MSAEQSGVMEVSLPENLGVPFIEKTLKAEKLLYGLRIIPKPIVNPSHTPLALPSRFDRGKLYREAKALRKSSTPGDSVRQEHMDRYRQFHKIEHEFHRQQALELKDPVWGSVTACYAELNKNATDENPIMLIPGASNGVESMDTFVREMAMKYPNRRIFVLGYPEAPSGKITKDYHDKVVSSSSTEIHEKVMKMMINHLIFDRDFELWGYSFGGLLANMILTDKDFAERITNAVLVCPFGTAQQTKQEFSKGGTQDLLNTFTRLKYLPQYVWINGSNNDAQQPMKFATWSSIHNKGLKDIVGENLQKIHLRDSAKVVIISGEKDMITKSVRKYNNSEHTLQEQYPYLHVGVVPEGLHNGPFLQPDEFLNQIQAKLSS